jgi:hypothetical protein
MVKALRRASMTSMLLDHKQGAAANSSHVAGSFETWKPQEGSLSCIHKRVSLRSGAKGIAKEPNLTPPLPSQSQAMRPGNSSTIHTYVHVQVWTRARQDPH